MPRHSRFLRDDAPTSLVGMRQKVTFGKVPSNEIRVNDTHENSAQRNRRASKPKIDLGTQVVTATHHLRYYAEPYTAEWINECRDSGVVFVLVA